MFSNKKGLQVSSLFILNDMSKEEHRFYFSSKTSVKQNQCSFTVNLPFPLDLTGKWKCCLYEVYVHFPKLDSPSIYILSDFCETSLVGEKNQLPILRKVYFSPNKRYYSYSHPLYIPLKQTHISNFSLSFLDSNLHQILFSDDFLIECTIHFYKYGR